MIEITFFREQNVLHGFLAKGHADYDEEGYDIVCAGVSALTQTTIASLLDQVSGACVYEIDKGFLQAALPAQLTDEELWTAQVILRTLRTGLEMIRAEYPEYMTLQIIDDGR